MSQMTPDPRREPSPEEFAARSSDQFQTIEDQILKVLTELLGITEPVMTYSADLDQITATVPVRNQDSEYYFDIDGNVVTKEITLTSSGERFEELTKAPWDVRTEWKIESGDPNDKHAENFEILCVGPSEILTEMDRRRPFNRFHRLYLRSVAEGPWTQVSVDDETGLIG